MRNARTFLAKETQMSDRTPVTLDQLPCGRSAIIVRIGGDRALRRRLLDMGLVHGETVTLTRLAPLGDPLELTVKGYHLSLRKSDACCIQVEPINATA
jgi:ferrous iron transport protein A